MIEQITETETEQDSYFDPCYRIILMVGLPRSGKTTEALKAHVETFGVIVNPDSIRIALHGHRFIPEAEPWVWAIARTMAHAVLIAGIDTVIIDATNNTVKRRQMWVDLAKGIEGCEVSAVVLDTDADECKRRAGDDSVIIPVIDRMAKAFEPIHPDEDIFVQPLMSPDIK